MSHFFNFVQSHFYFHFLLVVIFLPKSWFSLRFSSIFKREDRLRQFPFESQDFMPISTIMQNVILILNIYFRKYALSNKKPRYLASWCQVLLTDDRLEIRSMNLLLKQFYFPKTNYRAYEWPSSLVSRDEKKVLVFSFLNFFIREWKKLPITNRFKPYVNSDLPSSEATSNLLFRSVLHIS